MRFLIKFLLFFAIVINSQSLRAEDVVTTHILAEFDKTHFKEITPISKIAKGGIKKLWGWLKFESDSSTIKPQTYYLEWIFTNTSQTDILGNYNTNKKILIHTRKLDRVDDYYWVSKRLWVANEGRYIFKVYIMKDGIPQLIKEAMVNIEE